MKQPHTEQTIDHTDGQQNTGNHKAPGTGAAGQVERVAGTRAGAENVETDRDSREESVESGPDVDRVSGLDETHKSTKTVAEPRERHPERDEHGRM